MSYLPVLFTCPTQAITILAMFPALQTPPATQAPPPVVADILETPEANNGPKRHKVFYETSENLPDVVILKVRCQIVMGNVKTLTISTHQAGNTLYCLSRYYLMSGCEVFSDIFSMPKEDTSKGTLDTDPVVLHVGSMGFNVYLLFNQT